MRLLLLFSAHASGHGVADAGGSGDRATFTSSGSYSTIRLSSRHESADLSSGAHCQNVRSIAADPISRTESPKRAQSRAASTVHDGTRPTAAPAAVPSASASGPPSIPDHVPPNPDTAPHDAGSWNALFAAASTTAGPHSGFVASASASTTARARPLALIEFLANLSFFFLNNLKHLNLFAR